MTEWPAVRQAPEQRGAPSQGPDASKQSPYPCLTPHPAFSTRNALPEQIISATAGP
jgi:hypothetical protein